MDLKQEAIRLAVLGYRVFPCMAGEKKPATGRGFRDATSDPDEVEKLWGNEKFNIGIATDGLLVIDIDGPHNAWKWDAQELLLDLTVAPSALTPRKGKHFYFRQPVGKAWRCTTSKLFRMVDTRADGGYACAPPSVTVDGQYIWINALDCEPEKLPDPPDWLQRELDFLAGPKRKGGSKKSAEIPIGDGNPIPMGQRNSALASIAGHMRRAGCAIAEIMASLLTINETRCVEPLDEVEVKNIARSICRYEPDQGTTAAVEHHWEQLNGKQPPDDCIKDPGEIPADLLDVPGLIGQVAAYTNATSHKSQRVLAMAGAISLMATITGRKVRDEINTRTNLYILAVCGSGGGKERARIVNKELLQLAGCPELIGPEGIASHAGLLKAVEAQPSLLLQLDEIGRFLKTTSSPNTSSHLYNIVTYLMKLFTSSATLFRGDAYADTKKALEIDQPSACIYGTTVPKSFFESLTIDSLTDGFLSRLLIFEGIPKPSRCAPVFTEPDAGILDQIRQWNNCQFGGNMAKIHPQPKVVQMTPAAMAVFDQFDSTSESELDKIKLDCATLWTRAVEKARKLALIHACSRSGPKVEAVEDVDAFWACRLVDYLTRRMIYVSSVWLADSKHEQRQQRILREIRKTPDGKMTATQLTKATKSLTRKERDEAIESLKESGEVIVKNEPTGGAPIRWILDAMRHSVAILAATLFPLISHLFPFSEVVTTQRL